MRPTAQSAVQALGKADLPELYRFWNGNPKASEPSTQKQLRADVLEWMGDPEVVGSRIADLGRRMGGIYDVLLGATRYTATFDELAVSRSIAYLSTYDLEAGLAVLGRRALVAESKNVHGSRTFVIPSDLGDSVLRQRRAARRGIFDAFTLRGHLDRIYDDPARAKRTPPSRVRAMYKTYSGEPACVARIERLPDGLRALIEQIVLEFGGILPRGFFDRMETELPHWNGRRWGKILEESLVGTVERLELGQYGINHNDETLIVFNEVALAWLKRVAVPGDPDRPHDEATLGVDLVSNISRFLSFIIDHNVRFTVRGEIFKTTEKRILQDLIPNPGRELERSEVLGFIYRFSRAQTLIESTGERTFALTNEGRDWEPQNLDHKLQALLEYVVEEGDLGGEYHHQVRMRRLFLRLVKRIEPETWYDIMYLPFLARNQYLCNLDEFAVDEWFASQSVGGHAPAGAEDLQRMAWNLVSWVRKRLYLLGLVDLGYDASQRPVAMRVTRVGAKMLGLVADDEPATGMGSLVATPDFEVVLFPTGNDAELTHDLDRFCDREKIGHLKHFRINEHSIHRGLTEGMSLSRMCSTLEDHARTPVPGNVLYSIRDWAAQAGLLFLNKDLCVRSSVPAVLQKFLVDPGVKPYLKRALDETSAQLKGGGSPARMRSLLRDLDYLVELE